MKPYKRVAILLLIIVFTMQSTIPAAYAQSVELQKDTEESKQLAMDIKEALISSGEKLMEGFKVAFKYIEDHKLVEKSVNFTKKAFYDFRDWLHEQTRKTEKNPAGS